MFEAEGIEIALFETPIDVQSASFLEQYMDGAKFIRVDAELDDILKGDGQTDENEALKNIFTEIAGDKTTVKFDSLKDSSIPAILNVSEDARRLDEMMKMYNMSTSDAAPEQTLVINNSSALIQKLIAISESDKEKATKMASYIYKLSLLSQKKFSADEMKSFMQDGFDILMTM